MTENAPGTKTILFTDVEGSTDLRTRVGDDAAHTVLREHEETVRDLIARNGGREVKSLGDGFMAAFVSARSAVDCAVAIQRAFQAFGEEGLRVRVGVNAGDVREEGGDLYGSAVNAAARIAAAARGRQILVSGVVKDLAGTMPGVDFVDRGLFWLKGFQEKWRLHDVLWSEGRARTASPLGPAERTPLAGREEEMADLRRLLDQALGGRGGMALIGGEPGLGKTRLAEEILEEASGRGFLALTGRCYEMEGAPPYMPLVEILQTAAKVVPPEVFREALGDAAGEVARLLPELGRLFADIPVPVDMPPEQARRYLLNSLRDFFDRTSRRRPLILLLDDLHWADESTLLLLQHTAERLDEMPAVIIGTYRDVELDVGRPLAKTLDWLLRHRLAHRVALRRLGEAGIRDMLGGMAGQAPPDALVKVIYSETEGNPFFVEEVFRHLSEEGRLLNDEGGFRADLVIDELDVPEGVRLVIGRRLQRLEEDTRKVLSAAAVLGRSFEYELVRAMDGLSDDQVLDAVEEAERARLIVPGGRRLQVLLRARADPPDAPVRPLAAAAAAAAPPRGGGHRGDPFRGRRRRGLRPRASPVPGRRRGRPGQDRPRAGPRRRGGHAHHGVRRRPPPLRQCPRPGAGGPPDPGEPAPRSRARPAQPWAVGRRARRLARGPLAGGGRGDHEATGQMAWELAHQLAWATRWQEAAETAARGLASLGDAQTPERAQLMLLSGVAFGLGGSGAFGWQMIQEGSALAERLGQDRVVGYALYCQTVYHWAYWNAAECVRSGRRAIEPLRASGDLWDLAALLGFIDFMLFAEGRIAEALPVARESLELCREPRPSRSGADPRANDRLHGAVLRWPMGRLRGVPRTRHRDLPDHRLAVHP